MNFIFRHAKISFEIFFHDGQVHFYVAGYKEHATLLIQQITSNYPDAEVKVIQKKDMPEIKPLGYTLQAASIGKRTDDVYPIKTYKYFEDDPLSSFTNNFGSLKKRMLHVCNLYLNHLATVGIKKQKELQVLSQKVNIRNELNLAFLEQHFML